MCSDWVGLGLFKEFNMTGTHQLNGLFHFLFAQVYRCKKPRGFLDYDFFQQFLSQGIFFQGVREHQQKTFVRCSADFGH